MMKKLYIITAVILLLSMMLSSCAEELGNETDLHETPHNSDTATEMESETEKFTSISLDNVKDYSIENIDGKYYLIFEDKEYYINLGKDTCVTTSSIQFSSLSELKNTILNYGLSEAAKTVMVYNMHSDSTGIEIIDLNEMYNFEFSEAIATDTNDNYIVWCGNYYSMAYYDESLNDVFGEVEYGTKSWLDSIHGEISYLSRAETFESVLPTKIIESDGKRLDIYDVSVSDTTPLLYYVLVTECENTFLVKCISEKREIPDDEWFLSFGLTPYIQK